MIPPDLRHQLDAVLGTRTRPLSADVWTELREWLERHRIEPPEELPREAERPSPYSLPGSWKP